MRPPIPTGAILQDRYRILSILGQGGFGRTYLAEDQGRFSELCALKELTPSDSSAYAMEKSKELFQREAQILYQIQHPQIPQFRATFEYEQRLFLVQDYVEGETYRRLLDQRIAQGYAFSETEVKQLLRQLLPVLAHIHAKGIIHRDIAPDNIILRQPDNVPVLIDFGVVKELATRFQSPGTLPHNPNAPQNTTVGKVGYAPPEQMQTGRAYANSDLYSLAVTAVVLLTGREPQELFDDTTMTWYWQRWVTVSPGFAQVLNKMMSYRPGDRYQTVAEVVQALNASTGVAYPTQAPPATPVMPLPVSVPPSPNASEMATMAVGRAPEPTVRQNDPVIPAPRSSVWDDPLAVAAIGLGLIVLTGIGTWAIVRTTMNQPSSPLVTETITASPTTSPTASITPSPSPTATEPVNFSQRLDIEPDSKVTKTGTLRSNESVTYITTAGQGEQLSAVIGGEEVLMTILGPNRQPLGDQSSRVSFWQGTLPFTGDYFIQLSPVKGLPSGDYSLDVSLKSVAPSPTPTISPTTSPTTEPTPPSNVQVQRVNFPPGATGTTISDRATPQMIKRYVIRASDGQVLSARVESENGFASMNIRDPDGQLVENASGVSFWETQLNRTGDYQIDVIASQDTDFQLNISAR